MPLTEQQIQRYARHILLPEVGGVGQERLLAAEVRVRGTAALVELAADYLEAAGVHVDAHSGPGLSLEIRDGAKVVVRVAGSADPNRRDATPFRPSEVEAASCLIVSTSGEASGELDFESGAIAACLAASEALRLILGIGEPERTWRVRGASVERA